MKIKYANGQTESAVSLAEAQRIIASRYPEAVYCDNGDAVTTPKESELRETGRILVWASESDSVGDAGENAVAEIVS